jgi:hypothetical protein
MIQITGLDDFVTSIVVLPCNDAAGHRALGVVHGGTPGTAEIAHATAYLADASWHATPIGSSEPYGKDMGVALEIQGTTLTMIVAEATPGGSGTTGRADVYEFPNSVPLGASGGTVDNLVRACLRAVRLALVPLG